MIPLVMPLHAWVKNAAPVKTVDGDTVDVLCDLGNKGYAVWRLRLLGLDTPEKTGATKIAGLASQGFVADWLSGMEWARIPDFGLRMETHKPTQETLGRWLADLWRISDGAHLNFEIVNAGMGVEIPR